MKKILTLVFGVGILMMPVMVGAAPQRGDWQAGFQTDKFDEGNTAGMSRDADVSVIITNIIKWLMYIMVFLSVLMFVVAGIMYVTAGDSGRADHAKTYITYAIIGLVVGLIGWVITNTIHSFITSS